MVVREFHHLTVLTCELPRKSTPRRRHSRTDTGVPRPSPLCRSWLQWKQQPCNWGKSLQVSAPTVDSSTTWLYQQIGYCIGDKWGPVLTHTFWCLLNYPHFSKSNILISAHLTEQYLLLTTPRLMPTLITSSSDPLSLYQNKSDCYLQSHRADA